jgi:hypothetical protein
MNHKLMLVGDIVLSPSFPLRLQHPLVSPCILSVVDMWEVEEKLCKQWHLKNNN